jgi:hypothetical protein
LAVARHRQPGLKPDILGASGLKLPLEIGNGPLEIGYRVRGSAVIRSIRFALRHAGTGSIRAAPAQALAAYGNGLFHPRH